MTRSGLKKSLTSALPPSPVLPCSVADVSSLVESSVASSSIGVLTGGLLVSRFSGSNLFGGTSPESSAVSSPNSAGGADVSSADVSLPAGFRGLVQSMPDDDGGAEKSPLGAVSSVGAASDVESDASLSAGAKVRPESSALMSVSGFPDVELELFGQQAGTPQPPYPAVVTQVLHPVLQLLHDAAVPHVLQAELKPPYPA